MKVQRSRKDLVRALVVTKSHDAELFLAGESVRAVALGVSDAPNSRQPQNPAPAGEGVKELGLTYSSVEGSRREPRRHASIGTPEGCFGADDKVVLASTGRKAYAGW